jgi:hypothetical protein
LISTIIGAWQRPATATAFCAAFYFRSSRNASKINDAEVLSPPFARSVRRQSLLMTAMQHAFMMIKGASGLALKTTQAGIIFSSPRSYPRPASFLVATKRGSEKWRIDPTSLAARTAVLSVQNFDLSAVVLKELGRLSEAVIAPMKARASLSSGTKHILKTQVRGDFV